MPKPHKNEKKKEFINRCIPIVIEDKTAENPEQATAICYSIWKEHLKEQEAELEEENKILKMQIIEATKK